ncbi:MAG TPA: signal recognition particle-docking protein FtsY [Kofleriaceae bacterium]|nr:signal recognition particle-docking protein FtsY [Kofleriaceae bacterium]
MTGLEIVYLLGALSAIAIFLFAVRRASERNQLQGGGQAARRRLRERAEEEEREEAEAEEARKQAEAEQAEQAEEDEDEAEEEADQEAEDEDEDKDQDEEAADADERAAERAAELRDGLARTRGGFVARLGRLLAKKKIDGEILGELEEVLLTADIGPKTAEKLFTTIQTALGRDQLGDPEAVWTRLREESGRILSVDAPPVAWGRARPFVLLVLGVNGVGKTTTIGKIAAKLVGEGKKVILAAGDTFRAAATEQLEIWGQRSGAPVVKGKPGGDPSSVIFDAVKRAQAEGHDIVIADTAGRLHTKVDLMEELRKVRRVLDKAQEGAPHETWLVLDSTTGQNAIQQAKMFKEAMEVTGIVLTKLDGTAKGGVILGICDELAVPVRFIGIGESVDALREFDPGAFVSALYEHDPAANAA